MAPKLRSSLFPWFISLTFVLFYLYCFLLSDQKTSSDTLQMNAVSSSPPCDYFTGQWVLDPVQKPLYDETCPFHRNAWNCLRNGRENIGSINSWKWEPESCGLERVDPSKFLALMRNRNIGFIGDSLNENFLVSFLCILRVADTNAKRWKKKGAWRGAYFPKFNVTVAYHRAVLLAKYEWQENRPGLNDQSGLKGIYRVDVDVPADDWSTISGFYDVLVFNTGHWWGADKFPDEKPLVFYKGGLPIVPSLGMLDGLKVVLENVISQIQDKFPKNTVKYWRLQSPRHFYGGDWNQNGSCMFDKPLHQSELDSWFEPSNNGVNKEARVINRLIQEALQGTDIQVIDLTHLSEFRADAHPAIWLGKKDAVAIWGQDCMHWCLPGVPDTWVDILSVLIHSSFERTMNDKI